MEAGQFPEEVLESSPRGQVGDQDPGNHVGCQHHRVEAGRFPGQYFEEA